MRYILFLLCMGILGQSNIADEEVPRGVIDGVNVRFTLLHTPNPVSSVKVYRNGIRQRNNSTMGDMVVFLNGTQGVVKFNVCCIPQKGDILIADYRW